MTFDLIHFNNAGSSLPPDCVLEASIQYLRTEAKIGGYETEGLYQQQLKNVYQSIATLINADPSEIAIVESATSAWNIALSSIPLKKGDIVLCTHSEYISNFMALLQLKNLHGFELILVSGNEAIKAALNEKVKLVCITHVASTNGAINDLSGLSELIHKVGAIFLLDACQSVGQIDIDVKSIGCDFLAATGRKFLRAPRGSGFLYARENVANLFIPQFLDFSGAELSSDGLELRPHPGARRFEHFEMSYASKIGLGVACDYALAIGMKKIEARIQLLANDLREKLKSLNGVELKDSGIHKSGIVTFSIDGHSPYEVSSYLRSKKINVSTSNQKFSIDLRERKIDSIIRASVHYYNTHEEINAFILELKQYLIASSGRS